MRYSLHNNKNRYDEQFNICLAALVIMDHICPNNVFKDMMFSKCVILVTFLLKSCWRLTLYKYIHHIYVIYYCIQVNYINNSQNEMPLTFSQESPLDGTTGYINELRSEAQQWPHCKDDLGLNHRGLNCDLYLQKSMWA